MQSLTARTRSTIIILIMLGHLNPACLLHLPVMLYDMLLDAERHTSLPTQRIHVAHLYAFWKRSSRHADGEATERKQARKIQSGVS